MATEEEVQPAEWVKILSKDGHAFIVPREVAMMSGTLKNMLSKEGGFEEASSNTCQIQERYAIRLRYRRILTPVHQRDCRGEGDRIFGTQALLYY